MGQVVLIYGKSGSGKTRSLKNFGEEEILFVNVEGKLPPFRNRFKYTLKSDDTEVIKAWLYRMPMKIAVIDDAGYILTNTFMRGHSTRGKGSQVFDLYNDIANKFWDLFEFVKTYLAEDVIVYIMMHEETNDAGIVKLKTIGKMLDEKVCLEGMVTICLRCMSKDGKHFFRTVTDSWDISKAPEEMFEKDQIPNDLKLVDDTIREYYGWNTAATKPQEENNNANTK